MNITKLDSNKTDGGAVSFEITFQPHSPNDAACQEMFEIMMASLTIFEARNRKYKDNWRRQGWRSPLFDLRRKVERVWDVFWDGVGGPDADVDDALDALNFCAILIRAIRENNRDGSWWSKTEVPGAGK